MKTLTGGMLRAALVFIGASVIAAIAVVSSPDPAGAHGVGGIRPTNYETVITALRPAVPGLVVRAVDLGDRLEVRNDTDHDAVVLGYDGEPFLRVGPRGAFENARSPATYLNRTRRGGTALPDRADPAARPVWRRIGDEPLARWHDHRAHWMGPGDPPTVRADPDHAHLVQRFRIVLEDEGRRLTARGSVRWIPPPSAAPWLVAAGAIAIAVAVASRSRLARPVLAGALVAIAAVETLHVVGAWGATTLGAGARLGASVYAIGAAVVALVALGVLWRRGLHAAAPLLLIAGLFAAIAGGLADVSVLTRSQLPTTLPNGVARAVVASVLGLGIGVAIAGAMRLRTDPRRAAPQPERAPS
jgi:hypothetical protein